jgi:hypothetical protein
MHSIGAVRGGAWRLRSWSARLTLAGVFVRVERSSRRSVFSSFVVLCSFYNRSSISLLTRD